MKKTLIFCLLASAIAGSASAQIEIPHQEIHYDVHYHWGLIDVRIAHGHASIHTNGDNFFAALDGNSIPWDGRIFCISDTLTATMTPVPDGLSREQVTYQNGWYLKPKVTQYNSGTFSPSDPANYKNILGQGTLDASGQTMEAITVTSDMLALYYYFRQIDFNALQAGQTITIPISGGFAREVTLTFHGPSQQTINGTTYPTYSLDFEYSYQGHSSGYPVHTEVSATSRIPILISASLPVGQVRMTATL